MMNLTLFLYLSGQGEVMFTSRENSFTLSAITWKYSFLLVKMTADLSMTSACLNCLLMSLATGEP